VYICNVKLIIRTRRLAKGRKAVKLHKV
jgi:hypothetical protein